MIVRLMTLLVWMAVLASAVAWGLPLFTTATPVPPGATVAQAAPPAGASLARLFGEAPPEQVVDEAAPVAVVDSRYRLVGVVAPKAGAPQGLALISVDGKPARAVPVGRELAPGLRLLTVSHRQAELGAVRGSPSVTLALVPTGGAGQPGMPPPGFAPGMRLPNGRLPMQVPPFPGQVQPQPIVQEAPSDVPVQPGAPYPTLPPPQGQVGDPGPPPAGINPDPTQR